MSEIKCWKCGKPQEKFLLEFIDRKWWCIDCLYADMMYGDDKELKQS